VDQMIGQQHEAQTISGPELGRNDGGHRPKQRSRDNVEKDDDNKVQDTRYYWIEEEERSISKSSLR